jgi:DNA polymerase V
MARKKDNPGRLKLYSSRIQAGFPSPADDFLEKELDLNELLVRNPASTFLVRVRGESMKNAGIFDGDVIVVDRTVEPENGKVILGVLNGEFTVKRIAKKLDRLYLLPENPTFDPIEINESMDFHVWGVVTYCLHKL